MGVYSKKVGEMHEHYVRPCECGGREGHPLAGSHRPRPGAPAGDRQRPVHFSALPWTLEQYDAADYQDQLGESQGVELTLDGWHAGLGGDTGWTKNIHPEYRIPQGTTSTKSPLSWLGQ